MLNVDKDEPKSQRAFLVQHNDQKVLAERVVSRKLV